MEESKIDYSHVDSVLRKYLSEKKYKVVESVGDSRRRTFTYRCESEDMPFWVKLGVMDGDDDKRIRELKNEVHAIGELWHAYPSGETDSFQLPPGPEDIFEEEYGEIKLYGYSRFLVEGKLLSVELREGRESFTDWVKRYVAMIRTIDTLPDLKLPRTEEKKEVNFEELITKNSKYWGEQLKRLDYGNLPECVDPIVEGIESYMKENKVVTGTVHGDLVPEHIVCLNDSCKPTIVNFTKLGQWYPRFWDVGAVYGWVQAVLGESGAAESFWKQCLNTGLDKKTVDHVRNITNSTTLGMLATVADPKGEGGKLKVGCEVFV